MSDGSGDPRDGVDADAELEFKAFQSGDLDRLRQVLEHFSPLIESVAASYARDQSDRDDLLSGVRSAEPEYTLHEVAMGDGSLTRSFGPSYETTSPLVRTMMSVIGPVACDPVRGLVAHAFETLPYIRVFGANGEFLRASQIDEFAEMLMIQRVDEFGRDAFGQRGARAGAAAYDTNKGLNLYGGDHLLWQVRRTLASEHPGMGTIRTYLLDIESGAGALISDGGIPLIVGMSGERFVATAGDMRPRLEVWTYGGS